MTQSGDNCLTSGDHPLVTGPTDRLPQKHPEGQTHSDLVFCALSGISLVFYALSGISLVFCALSVFLSPSSSHKSYQHEDQTWTADTTHFLRLLEGLSSKHMKRPWLNSQELHATLEPFISSPKSSFRE